MDNSFAREWAAVLADGLRSLTSLPQRAWRAQVLDLEELAGFLLHVEAQLDRARMACLRSAMTRDELRLLWHYKAQEVQQTLHEAALHTCLPDSWLAQRVLDSIDAWNLDLCATSRRPLQPAHLHHFQHRLEAMADVLQLYARAQQDHWEKISPPR